MIKIIINIIVLLFLLVACSQEQDRLPKYEALADYDKHIHEQQQKELDDIEKIKQCNFSNVILLKLFDGYIPIPNTYYFSSTRSETEFSEFVRHPWRGVYAGSVLTGSYENLMKSSFSTINTEIMEDFEQKYRVGGLNVIKRKLKDIYSTDMIVMHDAKDFLIIQDPNNHLWKAMIESYEFLRGEKCDGL